jgi:hypothetical protein
MVCRAQLACRSPPRLRRWRFGADVLAFLDVYSMQRRTYGYAKQGSGFGHTKIAGKSLMVRERIQFFNA